MDKYLGKRLDGRYEMRELIGVGGMAYVYKAYDSVDDRTVAVKILRDEFLSNEEFTRRFRNESKAIAILNHPNIVKVLDVGFGQYLQYIVMEYIDGITLKEYLDQRRDIRWKEAVHFTVQILRALQHAHDKGIVHRDIKPQNIMLLSDGTIKVTDFGIARLSRSDFRATMDGEKAIGSVHYISPEQARGEITDEKADIYSVGVVLYEMLTGTLPFDADNAVSVAIMQMQSEPKLPHLINEDVPEGLEQITLKAMQKDADKRYQSAAEMLSDIDEFKRNPSIKFAYTYFIDETPTRYVDAITRVRGEEDLSTKSLADDSEEPKEKKKISTVAILSAVAAAIVLIVCVIGALLFNWLSNTGAKENITVDDFVGKHYMNELYDSGLLNNYDVKMEQAYNSDYEEGYVYKQEPSPGTTIKMRGTLTLYVSKGSKKVTIPQMTPGENAAKFKQRLDLAGFEVVETMESSAEYAEGTVIRLDPEAGTDVEAGSTVTMYISSGEPDAEPIDMPNVNGMEKDEAIGKLVVAGFDQTKITIEEVNSTAVKNTVVAVSPDYSEKQYADVNIKLQVSTGFRDVNIDLELPYTDTTVDLQFYVDGKLDAELTDSHANIMPKDIESLTFKTTLAKESYKVTVKIRASGKEEFAVYAEYQVDGAAGTYELTKKVDFVDTKTTTTTTTTKDEPVNATTTTPSTGSSDVSSDTSTTTKVPTTSSPDVTESTTSATDSTKTTSTTEPSTTDASAATEPTTTASEPTAKDPVESEDPTSPTETTRDATDTTSAAGDEPVEKEDQ